MRTFFEGLMVGTGFLILGGCLAWASQTYILPVGGVEHSVEHLTDVGNRDEAERSHFAGPTAPTSPTPIEGQIWREDDADIWWGHDGAGFNDEFVTMGDVLSGVFTGTYTLGGTPTITNPAISGGTRGGTLTGTYTLGGTPTITSPSISNGTRSGTLTGTYTLGGTPTITGDVSYGSTKSCESGYTRVGIMCIDTDAVLTQLLTNSSTSTVNDTTINSTTLANANIAILRSQCFLEQDGTAETSYTFLYLRPFTSGDQTANDAEKVCGTRSHLASESSMDLNDINLTLDSNGDFEWEKVVVGVPSTTSVTLWLVGYID